MNRAVKSGLFLGLISIIISLLVYLIEPTYFVKWWFQLVVLLISICLVIYFGIQYRKNEQDNVLTFKGAYINSLVIFIVGGVLGMFFSMLLFLVIDPDLPSVLTEASIQQSYEMMRNFGAPDEAIDDAIEQIKNDIPESFTVGGMLKNTALSTIFYLLLSLLTAAFIKKKKPEFD